MPKTKVTKKGQITIPLEYREEFDLNVGTVVEIKKVNNKLMIEKPMKDIMELKGAWKDVPDKVFEDMKKAWSRWNGKNNDRF